MKDGLENIDKIFKQSFDGFESNVDPQVWNNIQNAIGSGSSSTPQVDPSSVTGIAGKSLALKIVAGVALVGTVAISGYFISTLFGNTENVISKNSVVNNKLTEITEKSTSPKEIEEQHNKVEAIENTIVEAEKNSIENNQPSNLIQTENEHGTNTDVTTSGSNDVSNSSENKSTPSPINDNQKPSEKPVTKPDVNNNDFSESTPPLLNVKINTNVSSGKAPLDVEFSIEGNNIVSYSWDFNDGSASSNSSNPIHTFNTSGIYMVSLTVMDKNLNTKTIPYQIKVEQNNSSSIDKKSILKVFSPNGDGINDVIKITGENIKTFHAEIFNVSNGEKAFEWDSIEGFWDGRDMSGNLVPKGTYMLLVKAIGQDDEVHTYKSSITVLK